MSSEQIIGTISPVDCLSREIFWEVKRFLHLPREITFTVYSTSFMFQGQEWKLGLRPNFRPHYIPAYLMRKGRPVNSPNQTWKFHLGLKCRDGVEQIFDTIILPKHDGYEMWNCTVVSESLTRLLLDKETDVFSPGGSLIIFIRLSVEGLPCLREITTQTEEHGEEKRDKIIMDKDLESGSFDQSKIEPIPSLKVLSTLSEDLKNLYLSERDSDTTIKVGGAVFRVHKSILEARIPGITSKLCHNPVEACDPKAFNVFLQFLYSGDLENLSFDNVTEVYGIANKFNQSKLKEVCVNFMVFNLSAATVCKVLRTAVNYGESDLQQEATEFLLKNAVEVISQPEWERFMVENPTQAQKLIIESMKYTSRDKDSSSSDQSLV